MGPTSLPMSESPDKGLAWGQAPALHEVLWDLKPFLNFSVPYLTPILWF